MTKGLTTSQHRRLKALESQIAKGATDIYEALRAIHDEKLYLAEHKTFENYCLDRWGIGRSRAYQLLQHGQVLRLIEDHPESTIVDTLRESHTREVSDLPPAEAAEVVVETARRTGGKVTAKEVRRTRDPFEEAAADPFGGGEGEDGGTDADGTEADEELPPPPAGKGKDKAAGKPEKTPEELFRLQKAKTVKTAEALGRAIGDLNELRKKPRKRDALIDQHVLTVIEAVKEW